MCVCVGELLSWSLAEIICVLCPPTPHPPARCPGLASTRSRGWLNFPAAPRRRRCFESTTPTIWCSRPHGTSCATSDPLSKTRARSSATAPQKSYAIFPGVRSLTSSGGSKRGFLAAQDWLSGYFLIFLIFFYVQGPTPPSTNTHTRTHARAHTQAALVGAADAHMRYRCVTDSVSAVACVPLCAGFTVAELVSGFGGPGPGRNGVRTGVSRQRRRPGLPRVRGKSWEAPDPV